jgi:ACDE family multidrug resistance protein
MSDRPLLRDPNLHVIFGVTLMAVLGVSSVTPAFPAIAEALGLSAGRVGLLIVVFTLPGIVLTPVLGVLGDRWGRKRIMVLSLCLFAVAGTACGFARTFELLLGLRLVQGMGAAGLGALNVTLVGDLFSGGTRTAAMGYNASVLSIGTAVYPAVGGALAQLDWHYPFFLPVLAVPVALMVLLRLENPEPTDQEALGPYLRGAGRQLVQPAALGLLFSGLVVFIVLYGAYLTYLPFHLEQSFGLTPLGIGAVMSSTSITTALTAARLGWLARRFPEPQLVKAGLALYVVAMLGMPAANSIPLLLLPVLLFGAANGIVIPSILTMLTGLTPRRYRAAVMSANGTVLRTGQTVGPIVVGAMVGVVGLTGAFIGSAAIALVGLAVASVTVRE